MKKDRLRRSFELTLCVAFVMYTLEDFTENSVFSGLGAVATLWLCLNLLALLLYTRTPEYRQSQETIKEVSEVSDDTTPKREFNIPLPTHVVNIQIFRRKEKVTWN